MVPGADTIDWSAGDMYRGGLLLDALEATLWAPLDVRVGTTWAAEALAARPGSDICEATRAWVPEAASVDFVSWPPTFEVDGSGDEPGADELRGLSDMPLRSSTSTVFKGTVIAGLGTSLRTVPRFTMKIPSLGVMVDAPAVGTSASDIPTAFRFDAKSPRVSAACC